VQADFGRVAGEGLLSLRGEEIVVATVVTGTRLRSQRTRDNEPNSNHSDGLSQGAARDGEGEGLGWGSDWDGDDDGEE
jgi:hypothetical protein